MGSVNRNITKSEKKRWVLNLRMARWQDICDALDRAAKKLRDGRQLIDGNIIPSEKLTPEEADLIGFFGYRLYSDNIVAKMTPKQIIGWVKRHWIDECFTDKIGDEDSEILLGGEHDDNE